MTASQSDLNAGGVITNVVSVTTTQTATAVSAQSNTVVAQNARTVVTKVADPSTVSLPGQTITYRVTVTNAGNVLLTQLSVVDNRVDGGSLVCAPVPLGGSLDVGASTVCTGSRLVTQATIDAAVPIVNTATATTLQSGPTSAMAVVNVAQASMLTLTKKASVGVVDRAGQVITYTIGKKIYFCVCFVLIFVSQGAQNTGTTVLDNFQVSDALLNNAVTCSPVAAGGQLGVGRGTTCVGSYTVTQRDMNAGASIVNEASATTTQAGPVSAMDVTKVLQLPSFTVNKTASPTTVSRAGDKITFRFFVFSFPA